MRYLVLLFLVSIAVPAGAQPKEALTVDMPGDVATMDPHLQWDTESYTVYRNIFDNLVTRGLAARSSRRWRPAGATAMKRRSCSICAQTYGSRTAAS